MDTVTEAGKQGSKEDTYRVLLLPAATFQG